MIDDKLDSKPSKIVKIFLELTLQYYDFG